MLNILRPENIYEMEIKNKILVEASPRNDINCK